MRIRFSPRCDPGTRWRQVRDNRATQHHALNEHGGQSHVVGRVTAAGNTAVGADGRASVALTPSVH